MSVLSHGAFHQSIGFAFNEMVLLEQLSQLPPENILRVLQSIPRPLLERALAGQAPADIPLQHTPVAQWPEVPPSIAEQRRFPRQNVLRGAQVSFGRQHSVVNVQVLDLSEGGCRIGLDDPSRLPDLFSVRIVGVSGERSCEVCWRAAHELGVAFLPA